jgi:DNA polymerase-4
MPRRVIHIDMDEFYVAVERLDDATLRGQCVLVGGNPDTRGVVSTASYEARKFGCHSAMPMRQALTLCPHAIVLRPRMERYAEVSLQIFDIFQRFSPDVEPLSIDEAFLDVTGCERLHGPAQKIAYLIQKALRDELGLTASVGVANNKFLAKLASDLEKPSGMTILTDKNLRQKLDPLPVSKMWGVGPVLAARLKGIGITTIGQLHRAPLALLEGAAGNQAAGLQALASGIDERPVVRDSAARSISTEETFAEDLTDLDALRQVLLPQVEQIASRLRRAELRARTITLKVRTSDFQTHTRSKTLPRAASTTERLWKIADALLKEWAGAEAPPVRLIGIGTSQFVGIDGAQLELFTDAEEKQDESLDATLDAINDRFGQQTVRRAGVS